MKSSPVADLERLEKLAYQRTGWCGPLVERVHALRKKKTKAADLALVEKVYAWFFLPFTLWTVNFHELLAQLVTKIENKEPLDKKLRLLVHALPVLPSENVQEIVATHEWDVQRGEYAAQLAQSSKYDDREKTLLQNTALQTEWETIKNGFDVATFRDHKGVIRRSLASERGFRPNWEVSQGETDFLFRAIFDVFCQKWDLYGMQNDQPLLQRLTMNLTPNGTMVFIPSWLSLDGKRSLNWKELKKLHAVRVTSRQGEKLSKNQAEQRKEAKRAFEFNEQAKKRGLRGDERIQWVTEKMKWRGETTRKLSRSLRRAKEDAKNR